MSGLILMVFLNTGTLVPAQSPAVRLYPPTEDGAGRAAAKPDIVLKWNSVALQAIRTDRTTPPQAARNLAIVHIAIFDAVNAVQRTYLPFRVEATAPPGTSAEAAAAAAAHHALSDLYPRQKAAFDVVLQHCLAEVPEGPGRDDGVELGRQVAHKVLLWRADDGADRAGTYTPRLGAGLWRPTPAGFRTALLPGWGAVEPFAIRKGTQHRPPGPPPLDSAAYAAAYREVKQLGGKHSTGRTAEQTQIAVFWADDVGTCTPPGHWNRIAQTVALAKGNSLAENARLFALLNVSLADAGILCWVFKFTYDLWRPVTAITLGGDDNPDRDPNWRPLLDTPPFPSYTSGHSTFSGAAAAALAEFCGSDRFRFTDSCETLPGMTRSFDSFSAAAEEAGMSRIYGGIHWQFDNTDGLAVGRHLGRYVSRQFFLPRPAVIRESHGER